MKRDIDALEMDMQRVVGKKTWDMCVKFAKMHFIEVDGCVCYKNMPAKIEEMIIEHIIAHPSSRLGMAYIMREDGLMLKTE